MSAYDAPACLAVASAASANPFNSWFVAANRSAAGRSDVAAPSAIMDCTNSRLWIIEDLAVIVGRFGIGGGSRVARDRRFPGTRRVTGRRWEGRFSHRPWARAPLVPVDGVETVCS